MTPPAVVPTECLGVFAEVLGSRGVGEIVDVPRRLNVVRLHQHSGVHLARVYRADVVTSEAFLIEVQRLRTQNQ